MSVRRAPASDVAGPDLDGPGEGLLPGDASLHITGDGDAPGRLLPDAPTRITLEPHAADLLDALGPDAPTRITVEPPVPAAEPDASMRITREGSDWAVQLGDARELLRDVPDHSVDFILTDPPYNLAGYSTGNIRMDWRADFNNDVAPWDQATFEPAEWLDEFRRVLAPTGNLFAFTSYNLLGRWHAAFDPAFDTFQFMAWHKTNPPPKLRRAGFLNSVELIACAWNRGHTWNFGRQRDMHNFIESPICMGAERVRDPKHPTQKPVAVLRRLLELASKPGDLVLDPFMGVGSTGVAALELGRRFVGFEVDPAYLAAATRRLEGAPKPPCEGAGAG